MLERSATPPTNPIRRESDHAHPSPSTTYPHCDIESQRNDARRGHAGEEAQRNSTQNDNHQCTCDMCDMCASQTCRCTCRVAQVTRTIGSERPAREMLTVPRSSSSVRRDSRRLVSPGLETADSRMRPLDREDPMPRCPEFRSAAKRLGYPRRTSTWSAPASVRGP